MFKIMKTMIRICQTIMMRPWWFVPACFLLIVVSGVMYTCLHNQQYCPTPTDYQGTTRPMRWENVLSNKLYDSTSGKLNLSLLDITSKNNTPTDVSNGPGRSLTRGVRFLTLDGFNIGRFGNQMFKYASLLGIARILKRDPFMRPGYSLDSVFRLHHVVEVPVSKNWTLIDEHAYAIFDKGLLDKLQQNRFNNSNATIRGYFQSWKYFKDITQEIITEFTFRDNILQQRDAILQQVLQTPRKDVVLVGVHVRRSDLLAQGSIAQGYRVPTRSYFLKAFEWMRTTFYNQKVSFLVTSDDFFWCKNNLNGSDVIFAPEAFHAVHLSLLASCDHLIISTGSFGWWGAWLAGGHVVYYKNPLANGTSLYEGFSKEDYFPGNWVELDD